MPVETNGKRDNKMMQPTRLGSGIGFLFLFFIILNLFILSATTRPSRVLYSRFLGRERL